MSNKPKIGFLGPQPYMKKAIDDMNTRVDVHELHPVTWNDDEIEAITTTCKEKNIQAVAGFAQKDAFHHILINERLGNTVPS